MGISPPTDLVFDVMRAADTGRAQQVVSKLKALSSGDSADFSAALAQTGETGGGVNPAADDQAKALAAIPSGLAFSGMSLTTLRNAHALSGRAVNQFATTQPEAATLKKFEGMVLSKFLDTMMPATSSVFGSGIAGSTWKSMLTEKMGESIAQSGGIGIAATMARAAAARNAGDKSGGST